MWVLNYDLLATCSLTDKLTLLLVVQPDGDEEDVYEMEEDGQPVHPSNVPLDPHTYETPPILPPLGPFRVGILPRHGLGGIRGRGRGG
jgi:hypothetical protein